MNLKFVVGTHGYTLFNDEGDIEVVLIEASLYEGFDELSCLIEDWVGSSDWHYEWNDNGEFEVYTK